MPGIEFKFRGLIAPVFTPFNDDSTQSLNLSIIPQYAEYLAKKGINGVLVGGTTGEGTSLSVSERKAITEEWVKAVKITKQHLMVQIGGAPIPDVLELAKHAESLKVDSLLCLPELYFKPTAAEQLINYLRNISYAAPNTPLLYYHIPMFTSVNIHMGKFLEEIGERVPTFVGIKFTSNNLEEGYHALKADSGRFAIFLGNDLLISSACSMEINSFIATSLNIFPELSLAILDAWKNKDMETANRTQDRLREAVLLITKHGSWVESMKTAMNSVTPLNMGFPRSPLNRLGLQSEMTMKSDLETFLKSA